MTDFNERNFKMGKFETISQLLDPRKMVENVESVHDTARGRYSIQSPKVDTYKEYEDAVVHYVDHIHREVFNGATLSPEMLLQKAKGLLDSSMGFKNGAVLALTGKDGGLIKIFNEISDAFKAEHRKAYFEYIIDEHIDPLSFNEIVKVMTDLQDKIQAFSTQGFKYVEPNSMAADYRNLLWDYINQLGNFKNLWDHTK
jgi:hypothetical protein